MTQPELPQNPFEGYGHIIVGDRFVERKEELRIIANLVTGKREGGSLAIVGLQGIGKSSLIWNAIVHEDINLRLMQRQILVVYIRVSTFDPADSTALFHAFVSYTLEKLETLSSLDKNITHAAQEALQAIGPWSDVFRKIQKYFVAIRQAQWRPVIVLDEFDHAIHLFREKIWAFQSLLSLVDEPSSRITLVTLSRRSIREIEEQSAGLSVFDRRLHKLYMPMFTSEEIEELFKRLAIVGIEITDEIRWYAEKMCGGNPYLLERLCYQIADEWINRKKFDLQELSSWRGVSNDFYSYYAHLTDLLRKNGSLPKLLEIVFGPQVSATRVDADNFLRYHLIKERGNGYYAPFSEHFKSYLQMQERAIDLWPLWRQTEQALRALITKVLVRKYGDEWTKQLAENNSNIQGIINSCRQRQLRDKHEFSSDLSSNLLDYTYPMDLWNIIAAEWSEFVPIFKSNKDHWNKKFSAIAKVRNPMAHNRDLAIAPSDRYEAEGACKAALERMEYPGATMKSNPN